MENIEVIRRNYILEIKKKIKNNQNWIHPCNKERLEYQEKLNFKNGYEFICWMQQNGILKSPTDVARDYDNNWAINKGFKGGKAERIRNWRYKNGINSPMSDNKNCTSWLGVYIGEKLLKEFLMTIFEYVKNTEIHDRGIDFFCKDPIQEFIDKYPQLRIERNKEYKIQLNTSCLGFINQGINDWYGYTFQIRHNNITDYFILVTFDNRYNLKISHIWIIHRDEMIRNEKFWRRETFRITNKLECMLDIDKYSLKDELITINRLLSEIQGE